MEERLECMRREISALELESEDAAMVVAQIAAELRAARAVYAREFARAESAARAARIRSSWGRR